MWAGPAVALGLLVVLGVLYFALSRPASGPKAPAYLLHVTTDEISALEFHAHNQSLTLYANPGTAGAIDWTIGRPGGIPADNNLVQSFVSSLVTLTPARKLMASPSAGELQSFGLSPAGSVLIVHLKSGLPSVELHVGQTAPTGEYYAQVAGDPAVYLIDGMVAGEITADPKAWLPVTSNTSSSAGAPGAPAGAAPAVTSGG